MENLVGKLSVYKAKVLYAYTCAVTSILFPRNVYADDTALKDSNAGKYIAKLILILCDVFRYVGIALFVWGVIQFILAVKRTDAESKSDALQTCLAGVALIAIKTLVLFLGIGDEDATIHFNLKGGGTNI